MPITTNGLTHYWHTSDGVKSGNVLNNIAPGGPANPLNITGGTVQANGTIRMDGIDDSLRVNTPTGYHNAWGQPFTVEWYMKATTANQVNDATLFDGNIFGAKFSWSPLYAELIYQDESTVAGEATSTALNTTNPVLVTLTHNGSSNFTVHVNGTSILSIACGQISLSATPYPYFSVMTPYDGMRSWAGDFTGMRIYNRVLTAAEITAHVANGAALGMTTSTPRVKIGEIRTGGVFIPVYDIAGHPTQPLRYSTGNKVGFIPLVDTGDAKASKIRQATPGGIKAWEKL